MESKGKKLRARNKGNTQDPSWEFLHTCQQRAITWALNLLAAHIERDVIEPKRLNDHKVKSTLKEKQKRSTPWYWDLREISSYILIQKNPNNVTCLEKKSLTYILAVNEAKTLVRCSSTVDDTCPICRDDVIY